MSHSGQRQSSITRVTSGHAGRYKVGSPPTSTAKRPFENAMASRKLSAAGTLVATRCSTLPWAGLAEKVRVAASVWIVIGCEAIDALVRPIEIVRLAASQRIANIGCLSAGPNAAIEAPA